METLPSVAHTRQQFSLTLAAADAICDGAIAAVSKLAQPKSVYVTVLDNAGQVLVRKRMDGAPATAYQKISFAKARTCIELQSSSRQFRVKHTGPKENGEFEDPPMFTQAASMVSVMQGALIPVAGGVLIKNADGYIVGSVGVSGATSDEDEFLGLEGVKSLHNESLLTVPAAHCCTTLKIAEG